ncbi:MAG: nucleotide exchange factor GrpE [Candidatus Magasanikbacteria bacterium RIFOXYA2_FULL_44_8]|uniref:Protein GrpE n=1 Tax=Candidatus Magasanikbacteria bacterium RIFOXYA2_FULL_44_8 TaxID=1798696 RepID=A0A1F6NKZ1_9BACT|nr:MAG: nucleotide exchange factor GrpE [Candidatus Magasanikbacteria bacterium RIFOXYA2_FULL_44_8]
MTDEQIEEEKTDEAVSEDKEVEEKKTGFFNRKCKNCEKVEKECEGYKLGWQRALADYKNLQTETSKRRGEWAQMSEVQIIEEFIPVYDHLKMSIAGVDKTDAWVEGVKYVLKQFVDILKNHGVEEIKTVGEKFDPKFHEAAGEEEIEGKEVGEIVKEISGGYRVGERVIRAARVIINK